MSEFISAIAEFEFLQNALLACLLAGVACGTVGSYVVVRRIANIAGALSHFILGGMGAALYLEKVHNISFISPLIGAFISAVGAAIFLGLISTNLKHREDTMISALWALGMAIGVLFIYATPGYSEDLMSYLFGNILMISRKELLFLFVLDLVIILIVLRFHREFMGICLDPEYASTRGLNVNFYYSLLLILVALTVVLLVSLVGTVMVIALLCLPVATAEIFLKRLYPIMFLAVFLNWFLTFSGCFISFKYDLPAGACIIVLAGAVYFISPFLRMIYKRLRQSRCLV